MAGCWPMASCCWAVAEALSFGGRERPGCAAAACYAAAACAPLSRAHAPRLCLHANLQPQLRAQHARGRWQAVPVREVCALWGHPLCQGAIFWGPGREILVQGMLRLCLHLLPSWKGWYVALDPGFCRPAPHLIIVSHVLTGVGLLLRCTFLCRCSPMRQGAASAAASSTLRTRCAPPRRCPRCTTCPWERTARSTWRSRCSGAEAAPTRPLLLRRRGWGGRLLLLQQLH